MKRTFTFVWIALLGCASQETRAEREVCAQVGAVARESELLLASHRDALAAARASGDETSRVASCGDAARAASSVASRLRFAEGAMTGIASMLDEPRSATPDLASIAAHGWAERLVIVCASGASDAGLASASEHADEIERQIRERVASFGCPTE